MNVIKRMLDAVEIRDSKVLQSGQPIRILQAQYQRLGFPEEKDMQAQNENRSKSSVFLIDDDASLHDSLKWLILSGGYDYKPFYSAREFLANYRTQEIGCLLLDYRIPEMNGIELFHELLRRENPIPVIFVTGYASASVAIQAFQMGAFDFVEKPCNPGTLMEKIGQAVAYHRQIRQQQLQRSKTDRLLSSLTPIDIEVMDKILEGVSNKKMAADLGISERAIEYRRSNLMKKLNLKSVSEVIRFGLICEKHFRDSGTRFDEGHPEHASSHFSMVRSDRFRLKDFSADDPSQDRIE